MRRFARIVKAAFLLPFTSRNDGMSDNDRALGDDPESLVITYRNLVAYAEAGEDERTRARYMVKIPQMRAWWKAWQGDDSLYEMAFGEPPLEPKRTTLWQWLSLIPISICSPQMIALYAMIMAIVIVVSAIRWILWLAGVPTG